MNAKGISDSELIVMWGEGKCALAISHAYGVARRQIISRAFRLGLGEREYEEREEGAPVGKEPYRPGIDPRPDWLVRHA